jgi:hypothetical protein
MNVIAIFTYEIFEVYYVYPSLSDVAILLNDVSSLLGPSLIP